VAVLAAMTIVIATVKRCMTPQNLDPRPLYIENEGLFLSPAQCCLARELRIVVRTEVGTAVRLLDVNHFRFWFWPRVKSPLQFIQFVPVILKHHLSHLLPLRQRNRLLELRPFEVVRAKATIKSVFRLTLRVLGTLFLAQRFVRLALAFGRLTSSRLRRF